MNNIIKKILGFKMFRPADWAMKREPKFGYEVLNPPSWRERKIQNEMIDRRYEESVRAKADRVEPHWSDKYSKHFV